jgi:hypothetical protein
MLPLRSVVFVSLLTVGCSRPTNNKPEPTAVTVPPAASASASASASVVASTSASSSAPSAAALATPPVGQYPVGRECAKPEAIAKEKRTLAPVSDWKVVASKWQMLTVKVPDKVFATMTDREEALRLVSTKEKAHELGPDGKDRHFAIRIRRVGKSIDELLADKSKNGPLGGVYVEGAFPKRTAASFVASKDEPLGSGAAVKTKLLVSGKDADAYVFINGVEGYNTDTALISIAPKDTVVVSADWHSSIMMGQPECWQRQVIGGVVESISLDSGGGPSSNAVKTVAGNLEVVETKHDGFGFELRLAGRTLVKTDQEDPKDKRASGPHPSVVRSFGAVGSFDEVLFLRWDGMGNACNGYGYSFLQLKKDGTASLVDLDWCGGPTAELTAEGTSKVIVHRPKSKPNRGDGEIPAETWIYENGAITTKKK